MTDIRHTSDNTHLNNDNRATAENWSYTRHLSKLADQAKQQTDSFPSSPRDTDLVPSSSQDRGKRQLSAQELLEEEWCRVEPGADGKPPEKLVIPDPGYGGGMWKNRFDASSSSGSNLSKDAREVFKRGISDFKNIAKKYNYNATDREIAIKSSDCAISYLLRENRYKEAKEAYEYYFSKSVQWFGIDGETTMYFFRNIISSCANISRNKDISDLIVNSFRILEQKDRSKILDYLIDDLKDEPVEFGKCVHLICESMLGPNHSKTLDVLDNLVSVGRYEEAMELYGRLGRDHPKIAQVLYRMLDAAKAYLHEDGVCCLAIDVYKRAIPMCERHFGPNDPRIVEIRDSMASAYLNWAKGKLNWAEDKLDWLRTNPIDFSKVDGARDYNDTQRKIETIEEQFSPIKCLIEEQFGPNDPRTVEICALSKLYHEKCNKYGVHYSVKWSEYCDYCDKRSRMIDLRAFRGYSIYSGYGGYHEYGETDDCGDADGEGGGDGE